MATCKDCIHEKVCDALIENGCPFLDEKYPADKFCFEFKKTEVVRCKDCVHFTKGMAIGMCKRVEERPIIPVTYDHYCSYGKKVE